jgi:glycosyltransferase involved in cell wall biosynthesis
MRILQVAHGYPPDQMAGAEVYTWTVSRELARRGHDVRVFVPVHRPGHANLSLIDEELDGVRVTRLNLVPGSPHRLRVTYTNPAVDEIFARWLRELAPEVMHVQHTVGLSTGVFEVAQAQRVPTLFTLHDFWFHCPRGQRFTPRHHLCEKVEPWRCALCIGTWRAAWARKWLTHYARGRTAETHGEGLATRSLRFPLRALRYVADETFRAPILERNDYMLAAMLRADRILAPSRFLMDRFVEQGVPAERMHFSEYGMDDAPFRAVAARKKRDPATRPVRFGFIGTLMPTKGPDLLVRAFQSLPHGQATLAMHGAGTGDKTAGYVAALQAANRHPGVTFHGRFDNRRIAEILGSFDVLVVPSRWWENAPLTVHESVMARMPVVLSDHGGMRELAERFGNAVGFRPDDPEDLARALRRFLDEPGIWDELAPRREVRSVRDDVDGLLAHYADIVAARRG